MERLTCRLCGSALMMPDVMVADRKDGGIGNLEACVHRKPNALIFRESHYEPLRAWICGECGHADLYVENPQALYAAYVAAQSNQDETRK